MDEKPLTFDEWNNAGPSWSEHAIAEVVNSRILTTLLCLTAAGMHPELINHNFADSFEYYSNLPETQARMEAAEILVQYSSMDLRALQAFFNISVDDFCGSYTCPTYSEYED
jgi:hypothetical protein